MSDGDPSLEEDVPKPLLEKAEENLFTPKIATPIYAGGVRLQHKRSDVAESEAFLSDSQRNELAFQQLFEDGIGTFHEVSSPILYVLNKEVCFFFELRKFFSPIIVQLKSWLAE